MPDLTLKKGCARAFQMESKHENLINDKLQFDEAVKPSGRVNTEIKIMKNGWGVGWGGGV